jgi:hypothetical protein
VDHRSVPSFQPLLRCAFLLGLLLAAGPAWAVFDALPDDLRPLADAAQRGQPDAAWRLVEALLDRGMGGSALRWAELGAEQGDCRCIREMQTVARLSSRRGSARRKWEGLALKHGCDPPDD